MATDDQIRRAIVQFGREFFRRYNKDQEWTKRYCAGDYACIMEMVEKGCQVAGITVQEYSTAIETNEEFRRLQGRAIKTVILFEEQM